MDLKSDIGVKGKPLGFSEAYASQDHLLSQEAVLKHDYQFQNFHNINDYSLCPKFLRQEATKQSVESDNEVFDDLRTPRNPEALDNLDHETKRVLTKSRKEHGNSSSAPKRVNKPVDRSITFKCTLCDFSTVYKHSLKNHQLRHTSDKKFACDQCSFCTVHRQSLKVHKLVHLKVKRFQCPSCSYCTNFLFRIRNHKYKHHNVDKASEAENTEEKPVLIN
ncbi:UNVERIFIED_CONTAM: hypothetical protein RMT77_015966 [Armadillidium vulgare]|nr:Zinc finger protein [Armadillidium vulgare]